MNYYYSTDGNEVLGPHSLEDLLAHFRSGALPATTNICAEGQEEWQRIDSFAQPPPQPQPKPQPQPQPTVQARVDKTVTAATDRLQKFLGDEQDAAVVQKVHARALELCTQGEDIKYIAVQKKPIVTISPDAVLLTNKRVIIFRPKLIGMSFEGCPWRDVHDIHVKEGLLGATFPSSESAASASKSIPSQKPKPANSTSSAKRWRSRCITSAANATLRTSGQQRAAFISAPAACTEPPPPKTRCRSFNNSRGFSIRD